MKITIRANVKRIKMARLQYVLDYLTRHPLVQQAELRLELGGAAKGAHQLQYGGEWDRRFSEWYMPADHYFFGERRKKKGALNAAGYSFGEQELYAVSRKKEGGVFFEEARFGFDVFETIFFHISRLEEWTASAEQLDEHLRMAPEQQFLVQQKLEKIPVVDRLVEAWLESLLGQQPKLQTRYRVTHDIDDLIKFDYPWRILKSTAGVIWRKEGWRSLQRLWKSYGRWLFGREKDPYDPYEWLFVKNPEVDKVLYLLAGGESKFENPYPYTHKRVIAMRQLAEARGYEIGLHPSYFAGQELDQLQAQAKRLSDWLQRPLLYSRQHYLRLIFPDTLNLLETIGIREDSSLGFADRIGFRCGTGFPYHLYNFEKEAAYKLRETPMVVMDISLLREGQYDPQAIEALWNQFLSDNQYGTYLTFDFHNSRFDDAWLNGIPLKELYLAAFKHPSD